MTERPKKTDAIIIGAGISGLLSALALSKEGKKVKIFEKTDIIGGNARSYNIKGYTIDTGPHAITSLHKGPLTRLMNRYGGTLPKMVSHGEYYFRTRYGLYPVPASIKKGIGFKAISAKDKLILSRLILSEIINSTASKNGTNKSVYDIIKRHRLTKNTLKLIDTLCYFMSGASMKKTPSSRMLSGLCVEGINGLSIKDGSTAIKQLFISHSSSKGQKYPLGGIGEITKSVIDAFQKDMVEIITDSPAAKIIIEDGKAKGIESNGKIYKSDIVIHTGFVKDLDKMTTQKLPQEFKDNLKRIKQAKSYTLWLGLKRPLKEIDYNGSEIWFEKGESFWAMPTSNLDPHLAPKGKQLIAFTFIIKKDLSTTKKAAWKTIKEVFPGIESKIEMKHEQVTIPEKAAITTTSFFSGPKSPFRNLYLAGTDTDRRSMGITRASHSIEELIEALKKDSYLKKDIPKKSNQIRLKQMKKHLKRHLKKQLKTYKTLVPSTPSFIEKALKPQDL